jgi:hypothetical protein
MLKKTKTMTIKYSHPTFVTFGIGFEIMFCGRKSNSNARQCSLHSPSSIDIDKRASIKTVIIEMVKIH